MNTAAAKRFRVGFMVLSELARAKVAVKVGLACGHELTQHLKVTINRD